MILDVPSPHMSNAEPMVDAVHRLVEDVVLPSVERWEREDVLPEEVLERLGELGVPGALATELLVRYGTDEQCDRSLPGIATGAVWSSFFLLPAEGRRSATWTVEPLDKLGYRGVESAAWRFDRHHARGAEILGGDAGKTSR